jgi:nucleoside phosphorylase
MAIYLHFLDRELNSSVNAKFNPNSLQQALLVLMATTDEKFYCSLSLIFESGSEFSDFSKFLLLLVKNELLFPISHHPTLQEFVVSRKAIYKHDIERYPMYFQDKFLTSLNIDSVPILHKQSSTTSFLTNQFNEICTTPSFFIENHHYNSSVKNKSVANALKKGLGNLAGKALTFSAFKKCLPKSSTENDSYFIRRIISESYSTHYIEFLNADIITGIPEYSCYDYLSTNFPQHDYKLLSLFFKEIYVRLSSYQKRKFGQSLLSFYGTKNHTDFITIVNRIIRTSFLRLFSVTGSSLNHIVVRDKLAHFIKIKFIHPSLSSLNSTDNIGNILQNFTNALLWAFGQHCQCDHIFLNASKSIDIEDQNIMTTILIATATDLESTKLFAIAKEKGTNPTYKHFKSFSAVNIGVIKNCDIYFVQSQMGSTGSGGSALTINDAIEELKPDIVISLGIAFGSDPEKQKLGDVLVSTTVRCYEPERMGSDKIIPRGDRMPSSPTLINRCNTAKLTWKKSKVHTGLLLSGEKLVDNPEFKKKLLALEPEAVGGEMEGAGICAACYRKNKPWLIIKGICDWAENKDSKNQDLASDNAINFFWHILDEGAWSNIH